MTASPPALDMWDRDEGLCQLSSSVTSGIIDVLLSLSLPRINEYMKTAVIRTIYAPIGTLMTPGMKFLDLSIDLSVFVRHDCPPISYYRIALRDRAWLRRLTVARGDEVEVGAALALFGSEPDEPLDGEAARNVRISIAGILNQSDWWDADDS